MVDVTSQVKINAPVHVVSDYAANPDHAPEWYDNIASAEWQTKQLLNIGSKVAFKARFLGRDLAYVYEFVDYVPGHKLIMKTADGPFPMETTYTWKAITDVCTLMTLRNRGNPSGFSKFAAPLLAPMMKRANNKDLKKIKLILENRQ